MLIPYLPGKKAHLLMAAIPRFKSLETEGGPPEGAIESAVLVLLYPVNDGKSIDDILQWELLVIMRNTYDGVHSGQVAFPGGKCEKEDSSYADTACREAFEELGIESDSYTILGEMTHIYVPPGNFTIYPVLAVSKTDNFSGKNNQYKIAHREVIGYKHIPLPRFAPGLIKTSRVQRSLNEWADAPCYIIDDYLIWGATAMIISELYQLIDADKVSISFNTP